MAAKLLDATKRIGILSRARHSLQFHIRVFCCVALILFGLCAVSAIRIQSLLNYNEMAELDKALTKSYFLRMEKELDNARELSMQILADASVQKQLARMSDLPDNGVEVAKTVRSISALMPAFNSTNSACIRYIILVDQKGNLYSAKNTTQTELLFREFAELLSSCDTSGSPCWYTTRIHNNDYIILARTIREIANTSLRQLGYEMICLDVQQLLESSGFSTSRYMDSTEAFLNGISFYRGAECPTADEDFEIPTESGWTVKKLNGSAYLITAGTFMNGQITVINYANNDQFMETSSNNRRLMIAAMIIIMGVFLVIIIKVIDKLFIRLNRLSCIVREASTNGFNISLDDDLKNCRDEIGDIARCFQEQMNQIETLVNKNLQQQLFASQAQVQALQSQIHPHFLFNTLDTIHTMAEEEHSLRISRITESLSKLVRSSFRGRPYATLAQEIEFVQEYLLIYRVRFKDRLRAQLDWKPEDENIMLPRMTLQPIIENSVRYGLMKKLSVGVIRLRARRSGDRLIISFFDNGNGFSREMLEKYRSEALNFPKNTDMHGLTNVLYRLKTIYRDQFVFQIHSCEGKWTNIGFIIPIKEQSEEEDSQ